MDHQLQRKFDYLHNTQDLSNCVNKKNRPLTENVRKRRVEKYRRQVTQLISTYPGDLKELLSSLMFELIGERHCEHARWCIDAARQNPRYVVNMFYVMTDPTGFTPGFTIFHFVLNRKDVPDDQDACRLLDCLLEGVQELSEWFDLTTRDDCGHTIFMVAMQVDNKDRVRAINAHLALARPEAAQEHTNNGTNAHVAELFRHFVFYFPTESTLEELLRNEIEEEEDA